MKTICLTGMMGSGKTTIAKLLSKSSGIKVVDTDSLIVENEGMEISEIFKQKGEAYFRQVEKDAIKNAFQPENMVISLGGGAFEDEDTRNFLLNNSDVIYLQTSAKIIYERLKNDKSRPLLCGNMSVERIAEIIKKRENNYLSANKIIDTDNKSPKEIVAELSND